MAVLFGGLSLLRNFARSEVRSNVLTRMSTRFFADYVITPNLKLNTVGPIEFEETGHLPKIAGGSSRPLLVLLEYMNAKEKHVQKFVNFYLNYGFDVLRIRLSPWQLLWPVKGSQMVAEDVADFLFVNKSFSPMVLHGFSVGGYLWGEVLVKFSKDVNKYQTVTDRICGQIFDSAVDVNEIPTGFPSAVFPNNAVLRVAFEKYIRYHMRTFYNESTKHYVASRKAFTDGTVKAPTLMIFSDSDSLSTPERNRVVQEELTNLQVECYMKMFNGSKHVMHFQKFKDEYLSELETFLSKIDVLLPQRLKAKL